MTRRKRFRIGQPQPTKKALRECLEWLNYCVRIGWPKSAVFESGQAEAMRILETQDKEAV